MIKLLISIINLPIYLYAAAFTLSALWGWFITPVFEVAVPSYPLLLGISLIASYPNLHQSIHLITRFGWEEKEDRTIESILVGYVLLGVVLLTGYIYTLFI